MLDELAIETAQEKSRHKEELSDVRLQHEKEVLSIRARYEKELRGLHEEKNRTEEEIRSQLRDERVRNLCRLKVERTCRLRHEHSTKQNKHQVFPGGLYKVYFGQKRSAKFLFAIVFFFFRLVPKSWRVFSHTWRSWKLRFSLWRGRRAGLSADSRKQRCCVFTVISRCKTLSDVETVFSCLHLATLVSFWPHDVSVVFVVTVLQML